MKPKGRRYPDHVKHDAVRRWEAAAGRGSTIKRHAILSEIGCSNQAIAQWRAKGYGQALKPVTPLESSNAEADDVLDWLIDAGKDLGLQDDVLDRLLGHRVRWNKRAR